jgi:ComF family protein
LLNSAAESLFATLFPADCRLCAAPLINIFRLPVCQDCISAMHPIAVSTCAVCGERMLSPYVVSQNAGEPRCGLCRRIEPSFDRATAYGSYEAGLRELIQLLKYEEVRPAANVLGRMLGDAIADLEPGFGDSPPLTVPVPLHSAKHRQRGFNQSELIARAALKLRPEGKRWMLGTGILKRNRPTQSQIGLTRHQRRQNIRGAFTVVKPNEVVGREILLVDDVFTTGTTVSECARILRRSGASKVWVATVARTLKADAQHVVLQSMLEKRLAMAAHA